MTLNCTGSSGRRCSAIRDWKLDTIPYDIDLFDELEEGSLLIADKLSANALVDATAHAIQAGSVKRVGVLFTIDAEAFASPATLLKVNLAIGWKMPRCEGGSIPFNDIPVVAVEINRSFMDINRALLQSTRGNRSLGAGCGAASGEILNLYLWIYPPPPFRMSSATKGRSMYTNQYMMRYTCC